jgi:hypothetical protein
MSMGTSRHTERDEEQLLLWSDPSLRPQTKKKLSSKRKLNKRAALLRFKNIKLLIQLRFNGDEGRLIQQLSASHAKAFETLWLGDEPQHLPEKLARKIESVCGLDKGWLDLTHDRQDSLATKVTALDLKARRAVDKVVDALLHPR